jgi:hypothetical protein
MADEQVVVRGVSWNEVIHFAHLFKSFKMAVQPSKLMLALAAILLTYLAGRVLDGVWGFLPSNHVMANEPWRMWTAETRKTFVVGKDQWVEAGRVDKLATLFSAADATQTMDKARGLARNDFGGIVSQLKDLYAQRYKEAGTKAVNTRQTDLDDAGKLSGADKDAKLRDAQDKYVQASQKALAAYINNMDAVRDCEGGRIFQSFIVWETNCLHSAIVAVLEGKFVSGTKDIFALRGCRADVAAREERLDRPTNAALFATGFSQAPELGQAPNLNGIGFFPWLVMMGWGLWWLVMAYPIYAVVYIVIALAVWSVLGGAICRIAALHAARDEKIPIGAAIKFALGKFFSFFTAPLLPIVFGILVIGVIGLGVGGLLASIPYVGEWLLAILFFLALLASAMMAFTIFGLVGGWPMMWPTIAVEGSDSFDAMSRSYSYLFTRPWRYGCYWFLAAVYGSVCYVFVRLFAFLVLACAHFWLSWGASFTNRDYYALGAGKLDVMWAAPSFWDFHGAMQFEAMNGSEAGAAFFLAFWVYLVSGIVMAYLACYLISAATNIYYLMRQKVDATDLDDVYVEEEPESALTPALAGAGATNGGGSSPLGGTPMTDASAGAASEPPAPAPAEQPPTTPPPSGA